MAISTLLTIDDEVTAMILGLNDDLSYYDENGSTKVLFHEPTPREAGELEDATSRSHANDDTRLFVVIPNPGFLPGRWDGTEAPVWGRMQVQIRYKIPADSFFAWKFMHRMASRDSEVIGHEILTMDFVSRHVGDRIPQRPTGGLRRIGTSRLYLSVLTFDIEYHYDGS